MISRTERWPLSNIGMIFVTIIVSILMLNYSGKGPYEYLIVLPLTFLLLTPFSVNLYVRMKNNISILILIFGYFFRMVITPCLFTIGGFDSFFPKQFSTEVMTKAILMVCYEYLIVLGGVIYYCTKFKDIEKQKINFDSFNDRNLRKVLLLICSYLVIAPFIVPEITIVQKPFFQISLSESSGIFWDNETIVARGGIKRILYTLFLFFWPIVRIMLPCYLILNVIKRRSLNATTIILLAFILLTPFTFIGGDSIGPIYSVLISLIVIKRFYGNRIDKLLLVAFLFLGIAFSVLFFSKLLAFQSWRGGSGFGLMAQMLNAYIPGFDNTAVVLSIKDDNIIQTLLYDIYTTIPFRGTIFGFSAFPLDTLFEYTAEIGGQIIPFTAQISHFIGFYFAPFVTLWVVIKSIQYEAKSYISKDFWSIVLFTTIYINIAVSIHFYSATILLRTIVNLIIPMWCLVKFVKTKRI